MKNIFFENGRLCSITQNVSTPKAAPEPLRGNNKQLVKAITYAGIYLALNSLALDHMSGEELLTYIKSRVGMMAATTSSAFKREKAAGNLSQIANVPVLKPAELVKQIGSIFNKKFIKAA